MNVKLNTEKALEILTYLMKSCIIEGSNYTRVCAILESTWPKTYEIGANYDISKFTSRHVKTSWCIV